MRENDGITRRAFMQAIGVATGAVAEASPAFLTRFTQ